MDCDGRFLCVLVGIAGCSPRFCASHKRTLVARGDARVMIDVADAKGRRTLIKTVNHTRFAEHVDWGKTLAILGKRSELLEGRIDAAG